MRFLTSFGMTLYRVLRKAFSGFPEGMPMTKPENASASKSKFVIPNGAKRNEESLSEQLGKMFQKSKLFKIFPFHIRLH